MLRSSSRKTERWKHRSLRLPQTLSHENEPVSSVTLSVSSYGARIDNLATRTAFLRRGFGAEMVRYAMTKAKNLGYSWCCLESSRKGVPLYQKLGFREIYRVKTYG